MSNNAEEPEPKQVEVKGPDPLATPDLENEKLKLEIRLLRRQASKRWLALEWLKSGTVLVALLGVGVTLYAGFGQVKQTEQNRLSERLDKALTRLASEKPNERMTGVSSLRLFLNERDISLRAQALHFLVDAASVEADPLVQSAILDVFADLKKSEVSQADLDALLKTVIERNRSLAGSIRDKWSARVRQDKKQKLAGIARLNLKADQIPDDISQSFLMKLTRAEYLDLLDAERGRFEKLEPKVQTPLNGISQLITRLLKLGAKARDFSLISCQWCDFSTARDLSGAKFDKANLEHANFSRVNLKNASFKEANLSDTIFFAADLSNANLRDNTLDVDWNVITHGLPLFECANLKGADLSGTPLLVYRQNFSGLWSNEHGEGVVAPRMLATQIDRTTNLEYFTIVAVTEVSDAYLRKHPTDGRFAHLFKRDRSSEDPLFLYSLTPCTYRRFKADFRSEDFDETVFSSTSCIQLVNVSGKMISSLRPDLREKLSGFLAQPSLSDVSLLSAFNRELGAPRRQRWKSIGEYACDDFTAPDVNRLKINSGMKANINEDY